jgi:hypothetical protein
VFAAIVAASQTATGLGSLMSSGRLQIIGQMWVGERTTESRFGDCCRVLLRRRWPLASGVSCPQGACRTSDICGFENGQMRAG